MRAGLGDCEAESSPPSTTNMQPFTIRRDECRPRRYRCNDEDRLPQLMRRRLIRRLNFGVGGCSDTTDVGGLACESLSRIFAQPGRLTSARARLRAASAYRTFDDGVIRCRMRSRNWSVQPPWKAKAHGAVERRHDGIVIHLMTADHIVKQTFDIACLVSALMLSRKQKSRQS